MDLILRDKASWTWRRAKMLDTDQKDSKETKLDSFLYYKTMYLLFGIVS